MTPTCPAFVPASRTSFPSALARAVVSRATAPTMTRMQSPDLRACPARRDSLITRHTGNTPESVRPSSDRQGIFAMGEPRPPSPAWRIFGAGRKLPDGVVCKSGHVCPDRKLGRVSMRLCRYRCARSADRKGAMKECSLAVPRDESSTHHAPSLPSSSRQDQPTSCAHLSDTQTPGPASTCRRHQQT